MILPPERGLRVLNRNREALYLETMQSWHIGSMLEGSTVAQERHEGEIFRQIECEVELIPVNERSCHE